MQVFNIRQPRANVYVSIHPGYVRSILQEYSMDSMESTLQAQMVVARALDAAMYRRHHLEVDVDWNTNIHMWIAGGTDRSVSNLRILTRDGDIEVEGCDSAKRVVHFAIVTWLAQDGMYALRTFCTQSKRS